MKLTCREDKQEMVLEDKTAYRKQDTTNVQNTVSKSSNNTDKVKL